ncbi:MAG: YdaU family protein [Betaproteobacteria bacterium]|jgi:uncharacterized protein YdaU (DUF1376 family)
MNFVKLYIGDYQRDTGHLSIAEHGAYLLMLQHAYATEKPLPTGKALHRLLRAESKADRDAIDSVVRQFWAESAAGLVNARADEEIRKADHQRTVNREVGKLGGRPRKTESVTESPPEPEPNDNPSQTPDTRHQTPDKNKEQRARGTRLQLSALPEDWRAFCAAERTDLQADMVFVRFADYWRAQPGQRGVRVDWLATWRNWVRNERAPVARGAVAPVSKQAALEARNAEHAREFARRIMEQAQNAAATDGQ